MSDIADHLPIVNNAQDKTTNLHIPKHVTKTYRDFNDCAIASFTTEISTTCWDNIVVSDDASTSYRNSISTFSMYHKYFPVITKRVKTYQKCA